MVTNRRVFGNAMSSGQRQEASTGSRSFRTVYGTAVHLVVAGSRDFWSFFHKPWAATSTADVAPGRGVGGATRTRAVPHRSWPLRADAERSGCRQRTRFRAVTVFQYPAACNIAAAVRRSALVFQLRGVLADSVD